MEMENWRAGNVSVMMAGLGDCQPCGTCVCYNPDQYEGPYCQYDKTQCPRFAGILCNDGWEGAACECSKSNDTCLDSKGVSRASGLYLYHAVQYADDALTYLYAFQNICGGRGKCVCGSCKCPDSEIEMSSACEPNFQVCTLCGLKL
ncbi:hypothetical protein GOODEAATRI_017123 [Goodea atripinnis]|uniref:Epidermal growth factor-like domain-containing protein n=1 Tax=Goodea atripinnis TaxID=208336 RepID=A0ABV0NWK7_9TELE